MILTMIPSTRVAAPALRLIDCFLTPLDVDASALVPLVCSALSWNAAKLFALDSTALTEKTIPAPQWLFGFVCLQYAQIGALSLTWIVKVGSDAAFDATGMNPESNPTCPLVLVRVKLIQGSEKLLCVTLWLPCAKRKVIVSPTSAVMLEGSYVSWPFPPTMTI